MHYRAPLKSSPKDQLIDQKIHDEKFNGLQNNHFKKDDRDWQLYYRDDLLHFETSCSVQILAINLI